MEPTPEMVLDLAPRAGEIDPKGTYCGRPTTSRGPCRMPRLIVYAIPAYERMFGERRDMQWEMGGCKRHLTGAEKTFATVATRLADAEQMLLEHRQVEDVRERYGSGDRSAAPACWAWFDVDCLALERGYPVKLPHDLVTLEEWQQGRCAICGSSEALVWDHDPWSGLVRGLLNRACNREGFGRFALYRQRHPASMFEIRAPYSPGMRARPLPEIQRITREALAVGQVAER
jgi:hypothetical protein